MLLLGSRLPFDAGVEEQRNLPPMVMANEFAPELELPTVHIDNLTAAFNAVNYLHELGHQRIGCIAGPEEMPLCHYRLGAMCRRCVVAGSPSIRTISLAATLPMKQGPARWNSFWRCRCHQPRSSAIAILWRWGAVAGKTSGPEGT